MLRARRAPPAAPRWALGRLRLRQLAPTRGKRGYAQQQQHQSAHQPPPPNDSPNLSGFSYGSSTAAPGPRANEPRPPLRDPPKIGSALLFSIKTLWTAMKEVGDSFQETQAIRMPHHVSKWPARDRVEMFGETNSGHVLSYNNRRTSQLIWLTHPNFARWHFFPKIAKQLLTPMEYIPKDGGIIDKQEKPWAKYRKARERVLLLRHNWPAIPEDIKRTIRWDDWVFPGGRVDMFRYADFDPSPMLWTDVINQLVSTQRESNKINVEELYAEYFGIGIDKLLDEPEIGGPKPEDDPARTDMMGLLSGASFVPSYEPEELDTARRRAAHKNILREIELAKKRRDIAQEQWKKEKEEYCTIEGAKLGITGEEFWKKHVQKEGTYWGEYFNDPDINEIPEDYPFFEGDDMRMESPEREAMETEMKIEAENDLMAQRIKVISTPIPDFPDDPPQKPYKPDPPEVIEALIKEIRAEAEEKNKLVPDPYAKGDWVGEVMKRLQRIKELHEERQQLKQQVLESGNYDGYMQLKAKDTLFGGTFEMVGSGAEMMRIRKVKGHAGPITRALRWLLNQPYRQPTEEFPAKTWIPPFEQDPERYTLRAFPDPFEISTWRFRRTETGFLGRIADWFAFRNNGMPWWWMPGDQPNIRTFEAWWLEYKEDDDFWDKVAPHVLKASWFRRYAVEYFTGAEWRTLKDIKNLEAYNTHQMEYAMKALQHLYPREKFDFEYYKKSLSGDILREMQAAKPMQTEEEGEAGLRWGPNNEFREATTGGGEAADGWLLATTGTKKMTVREALEVLGYTQQLKEGVLPPLDEARERAAQLDAANQLDSAKTATGWRRVVREILRDPLLEPKPQAAGDVLQQIQKGANRAQPHSGKSPYLGGKANAAFLSLQRAHNEEANDPEDEAFMRLVRENRAAALAKEEEEAKAAAAGGEAAAGAADASGKPAAAAADAGAGEQQQQQQQQQKKEGEENK